MPPTAPFPVPRRRAKSSPHGVVVNVLRCSSGGFHGKQVSVVPWPFLPKPEAHFAWTFLDGQFVEQGVAAGLEEFLDPKGMRSFDGKQQIGHIRSGNLGPYQEVQMLGHVNKRQ